MSPVMMSMSNVTGTESTVGYQYLTKILHIISAAEMKHDEQK